MKYKKKPVIIDAMQWFGFNKVPVLKEVHYYNPYEEASSVCEQCGELLSEHGTIPTLEGNHIVCPNDWIITGVKGEKYPCKPDIFELTYERAL